MATENLNFSPPPTKTQCFVISLRTPQYEKFLRLLDAERRRATTTEVVSEDVFMSVILSEAIEQIPET